MTQIKRIRDFMTGIVIIFMAIALFFNPEDNIDLVIAIFTITFFARGIRAAYHYYSMGRYTVGGKRSLYRAMIYLDLGLLTSEMSRNNAGYIALYLAGVHFFIGLVDILQAMEAKGVGASWKMRVASGTANMLLGIAVIIAWYAQESIAMIMYVYAIGLLYTGCLRIGSAFRRNAIVYIQ